jgi:hypothetical protein
MFEREIRLNGLMHRLLAGMLADMDEAHLLVPICEGGNPPAWILGHLVVSNDYGLKILGAPRVAPAEWHKRFGRGMSPKGDSSPFPTKRELLEKLEQGREQMVAAAAKADPERMNQPHNFDLFKDSPVQTVGDILGHLMTTHFATHVGQFSVWRRAHGKPPLV